MKLNYDHSPKINISRFNMENLENSKHSTFNGESKI